MAWFAPVAAVFTVVQGISSIQAGRQAKRTAKANAELARLETEEEIRRTRKMQQREEALARAKAAASGVSEGGSMSSYIKEMEQENSRQLEWMRKAGRSRSSVIKEEGDAAWKSSLASAAGSFASAVGAGYDWWKTR